MRPSTPPSWGPVDTVGGQPTTASTDGRWFGLSLAGVRTRRNPIVHDDTAQSSGRRHHRTRLVILSTASRAVSSHARQSVVATWTDRHNGGVGVPLSEMTGHVRCSQESVQGADGSTRTYVTVSRQWSSVEGRHCCRPATSVASTITVASVGTGLRPRTASTNVASPSAFHVSEQCCAKLSTWTAGSTGTVSPWPPGPVSRVTDERSAGQERVCRSDRATWWTH